MRKWRLRMRGANRIADLLAEKWILKRSVIEAAGYPEQHPVWRLLGKKDEVEVVGTATTMHTKGGGVLELVVMIHLKTGQRCVVLGTQIEPVVHSTFTCRRLDCNLCTPIQRQLARG